MDVLILAGGKSKPDLAEASGAEFRADIQFGEQTLTDIVLEAVSGLGEPILVGGSPRVGVRQIESGKHFVDSLAKGLDAVSSERFLLVTVDLPFLTKESVEDFINSCPEGAGLCYPIVDMKASEEMFPGVARTSLKLKEGEFTGGNLSLMNTAAMRESLSVIEAAYDARKSPLKLAKMVGFGTLLRIIWGAVTPFRASLPYLESKVGTFLKIKVKGVPSKHAEIAADLDSADHYHQFQNLKGLS